MKYQIGDNVKIVSLPACLDDKDAPIGSIGVVVGTGHSPYYQVKSDSFTVLGNQKKEYWHFDEENIELVDTPQPKFKAGDKVKTPYGEFEVIWVGNLFYCGKQGYVCYKEGFDGHSAEATVGSDVFENTKYKGQCWNFSEDELELVVEDNCKQTPKNYRELTPDTLIDISIDGNEFKVPLGDLIHAQALIGVSNGMCGDKLYNALKDTFDKGGVIYNSHDYEYVDTADVQDSLFKAYFIDKEKEAKKQALKEVIEKQREEISKLEQQLIALDNYDGCSL